MNRLQRSCYSLLLALTLFFALTSLVQAEFRFANEQSGENLLAPSLWGPLGGFRLLSAQRAYTGSMGVQFGLHGQFFTKKDFFASGNDTTRAIGQLTTNFTPWPYTEFFSLWEIISSRDHTSTGSIEQFGNFNLGTKIGFDPWPVFSIAGAFQAEHINKVGQFDITDTAWNFALVGLLTLDLSRREDPVPLRLHANVGYRFDNSFDANDTTTLTAEQQFILGVSPFDQLLFGAGLEVPIDYITFLAEYTTEQTVGSGSGGFDDNPQRVTLGLRFFPTNNNALAIDAGADVGLFNGNPSANTLAEPDYNLIFGLTYTFISSKPAPKVPATGSIAGIVLDATSLTQLGGAIISFPEMEKTRLQSHPENGSFALAGLSPGTITAKVQLQGYETANVEFLVEAGKSINREIKLKPLAVKKKGTLILRITDADGNPLLGQVGFVGYPNMKPAAIPKKGVQVKMAVGRHKILVGSDGFQAEEHDIYIEPDTKVVAAFVLRETGDRIKLTKEKIVIADKIYFATGKWALTPNSESLLNRVADLINDNPQITKLQVEGHTDSTGKKSYNVFLSQKRAEAVMEYLISRGVKRVRLTAVGFGPSKPVAGNLTQPGRAANRRVEFTILQEAKPTN